MKDSHLSRCAITRLLPLALAAALPLLFANSAVALGTGSGTVSLAIQGHGTVAVTSGTNGPSCATPESNGEQNTYHCPSVDGLAYDACTDDSFLTSCSVTLTETPPSSGWTFAGWGGACSGSSDTTCTVTVSFCPDVSCVPVYYDESVTAAFMDTRAPTTSFAQAPANNAVVLSDTRSEQFKWGSDEDGEGVTYQCKRDTGAYSNCSSGSTWSSIADGVHDFCVKGTDASGVVGTPACIHWDQETSPTVSITSKPASISGSSVSFSYTSNKAGRSDGASVTYRCAIDSKTPAPCGNGTQSYSLLTGGPHSFAVYADFHAPLDGAGVAHTSVATYHWTVNAPPAPSVSRAVVALALKSTVHRHQRVLRRHGIRITARCNEACTLRARGKISIPGWPKWHRLRTAHGSLRGAGSKTLFVRLSKKELRELRRALHRHRKARVRITVTAKGGGASKTRRLNLKVTR